MRFPNLIWAIEEIRIPHYEFSRRIDMDPSRFSRCLNEQTHFAPHEIEQIAKALDLPADWLFAQPMPPQRFRVSATSVPDDTLGKAVSDE